GSRNLESTDRRTRLTILSRRRYRTIHRSVANPPQPRPDNAMPDNAMPDNPPDRPMSAPEPAVATVAPDGRVTVTRPPGADRLLLPPLINAHAHLALHRIGPRPYDAERGFLGWVSDLRGALRDEAADESGAAREAAEASVAQGTAAVGDIAISAASAEAMEGAGLAGVSYLEAIGLGEPFDTEPRGAIAALAADSGGVRRGVQPHAPYSAGPGLYSSACESGRPVCTHLAETRDELEFVARGTGPFRDFLESIGKWRPEFAATYSTGATPVAWMRPHLERRPWLLAHCNYLTDADIDLLAALPSHARASIAYCPIASAYFKHEDHRYRDLLAAGVNVSLGTDSILCQPPDEPQPYSMLQQMRFLHRRDGTDPQTLLRMATVNGAIALGLDVSFTAPYSSVEIDRNSPVDPLAQALKHDALATPLC
ncbi:MAG: amidohydrolase family protein, partial [Planctomycetota bacterium]